MNMNTKRMTTKYTFGIFTPQQNILPGSVVIHTNVRARVKATYG